MSSLIIISFIRDGFTRAVYNWDDRLHTFSFDIPFQVHQCVPLMIVETHTKVIDGAVCQVTLN